MQLVQRLALTAELNKHVFYLCLRVSISAAFARRLKRSVMCNLLLSDFKDEYLDSHWYLVFISSFCYQGGFHMQLYINSIYFLVLSSGYSMSRFRKNLESNALGLFGFLCFSSSPQLMLILSINSLLKVNSLLLGLLSVVLGFLLLLVDLVSQAPQSNGGHCLHPHFCTSQNLPEAYGPPWPVRNSWGSEQPDHTRALLTSSALSHHTGAVKSTMAKAAFRNL